jgi:drug/metabolite transporter, DME family
MRRLGVARITVEKMTPDHTKLQRERAGVAMLLMAATLWSLNGVFIKGLHSSGAGAMTIAAYRCLFAFVCVTPFALRRRRTATHNRRWLAASTIAFTAMCVTFVLAMTLTTAANAIFLQYTAPAWVFLLSPWITSDRASRGQYFGLVFAIIGVFVIFFYQYTPGQTGLIIGVVGGVVFGIQSVVFRSARLVDPVVLVWTVCGGAAFMLLPVAWIVDGFGTTPSQLAWLALMGAVQFAVPYVLYSAGLARVTAQRGVLLILIEPILSTLWVWLIIGETPLASTFVGGSFIGVSVLHTVLTQVARSRRIVTDPSV